MESNQENRKNKFRFQTVQILAIGFAVVILAGAFLIMLPISSASGKVTPFINALFTSTSAVCVTGLVVVDTGTYFSVFGQVVIMILIEIGGLGFMTFATFLAVIVRRRISLKERLIMQEAYNSFNLQGMVRLMLYVMGITFSIEGIGAILLSTEFIKYYGVGKGIYFGIFHSIAAFCNAGFDLIGGGRSLTPYVNNTVINLTIMGLIVTGGIGFAVIAEILRAKGFRRLSLHTKVVLTTTALLLIIGFILFFIFEYNNPKTIGQLGLKGKILASMFASVTPRTAGFNTVPTDGMTTASQFLTIILMFVGASPGSTGGGIKTSTATLIFIIVLAVIRGREDAEIFHKRISRSLVYRAVAITVISFSLVVVVTMILSVTQQGSLREFLYETTSAFGTVGLTLGLTPRLNFIGKLAITLTMYAGRVGPLTLALAFAHRQQSATSKIRYPEDKILVG